MEKQTVVQAKAALTARALVASLPDLLKLDGYERKARSKRDKAFTRHGLSGEPRIWRNEPNLDLPLWESRFSALAAQLRPHAIAGLDASGQAS